MKRIACCIVALLLSALVAGCETTPLANRLSMSLAEDEAYVNSMYGWIGVTSKIDKRDVEILREIRRLQAQVAAIQRAQIQARRDALEAEATKRKF